MKRKIKENHRPKSKTYFSKVTSFLNNALVRNVTWNQCDLIGRFSKFSVTNNRTKVAQKCVYVFNYSENITFHIKIAVATFWITLGRNCATF